jgi:uncharacterized membrane protein
MVGYIQFKSAIKARIPSPHDTGIVPKRGERRRFDTPNAKRKSIPCVFNICRYKGEITVITINESILIRKSQQEVFDFATNPANDPKWQGSAVSSEWASDEPAGAGSRIRTVNKFLGREIESMTEVTAWDPPNEFGFKVVDGPVPFEMNIQLNAVDGGTQIEVRGSAEAGSFFKLAEGLVGKQLQNQIQSDFKKLKKLLEE